MKIVIVTWADAHAGPHEWSDPDELEDSGEYLVVSVGHLLTEGDGGKRDHVTLAQSMSPDGLVDHIIHIPAQMVRRLTTPAIPD